MFEYLEKTQGQKNEEIMNNNEVGTKTKCYSMLLP